MCIYQCEIVIGLFIDLTTCGCHQNSVKRFEMIQDMGLVEF